MLTALFFSIGVAAAATPNACQVLTPRDIARVQGAKYKKTRLTESSDSGVTISQCFYALPRLSDSVTVDLIRGQAREFWQKHFADINEASVPRGCLTPSRSISSAGRRGSSGRSTSPTSTRPASSPSYVSRRRRTGRES